MGVWYLDKVNCMKLLNILFLLPQAVFPMALLICFIFFSPKDWGEGNGEIKSVENLCVKRKKKRGKFL